MSRDYWWHKAPEVVRQPVVVPLRRTRTAAEVDLDRRLEENAARVAGAHITKDEWARAQYRASSRAGATHQYYEGHYGHGDMVVMEAHVDQIFWQMVRKELRDHPKLQKWLEFIENYYEVPQHEFLERIKKRHWAQMQVWTDDRRHQSFLQEVYRAWHAAQEAIQQDHPDLPRWRQLAEAERRYEEEQDQRFYDDMMMAEVLESLGQ